MIGGIKMLLLGRNFLNFKSLQAVDY